METTDLIKDIHRLLIKGKKKQVKTILQLSNNFLSLEDSTYKLKEIINLSSILKQQLSEIDNLVVEACNYNDELSLEDLKRIKVMSLDEEISFMEVVNKEALFAKMRKDISIKLERTNNELERLKSLKENGLLQFTQQNDMELKQKIELTMLRNRDENIDYNIDESIYYKTKLEEIRAISLNKNKNPISEATFIDMEIEYYNQLFEELKPLRKFNDITLVQNFIGYLERKKTGTKVEKATAILKTKFNDIDTLRSLYPKLNQYIKCDLNSWMYWFGGVTTGKPQQIEFLKTRPELLYFIEKLCPDDFKNGQRKIKELNQIFKPINGKKVDSTHKSVTLSSKKSAIDKLFK